MRGFGVSVIGQARKAMQVVRCVMDTEHVPPRIGSELRLIIWS